MENYLDNAPCIYFSCSDDGRIINVNQTACQRLGYAKAALTGNPLDLIFTMATRIFQQTHFFPLLKMQGHAEEIYITLLTKEKAQLPVLINAKRSEQGVNEYVGIIVPNRKKFEDELIAAKKAAEAAVTENKELAEARSQLQSHIEQLDEQMQLVNKQNNELRQFNHVVTHDLQEPIRKLFLFVNMMLDSNADEKEKAIADKIRKVSEQMRAVVSDLQQYIWLTGAANELAEIDLGIVLRAAQEQISTEFPNVPLIVETEQLPSIEGDAEQLQLMFYHLLSNVIRFRKAGSQAYAHVAGTSLMLNKFRNIKDKYKYNEVVKLVITDKGIGIGSHQKEAAFGLFKRLHPESGRGVGLALCRKVVENHGGTIEMHGRKDEGAAITVILPVKQAADSPGVKFAAIN